MGVAARRREKVSSGLDVLVEKRLAPLRGLAVGLICNPTAVDRRLRHAADLRHEARDVRLAALFGPELGSRAPGRRRPPPPATGRPRSAARSWRDRRFAQASRVSAASTTWRSAMA